MVVDHFLGVIRVMNLLIMRRSSGCMDLRAKPDAINGGVADITHMGTTS